MASWLLPPPQFHLSNMQAWRVCGSINQIRFWMSAQAGLMLCMIGYCAAADPAGTAFLGFFSAEPAAVGCATECSAAATGTPDGMKQHSTGLICGPCTAHTGQQQAVRLWPNWILLTGSTNPSCCKLAQKGLTSAGCLRLMSSNTVSTCCHSAHMMAFQVLHLFNSLQ